MIIFLSMITRELNFYLTPTFNKYPLYFAMATIVLEILIFLFFLRFETSVLKTYAKVILTLKWKVFMGNL